MLALKRQEGERVKIGESYVQIVRIKGKSVTLGIDAPKEINIVRAELLEKQAEEESKP